LSFIVVIYTDDISEHWNCAVTLVVCIILTDYISHFSYSVHTPAGTIQVIKLRFIHLNVGALISLQLPTLDSRTIIPPCRLHLLPIQYHYRSVPPRLIRVPRHLYTSLLLTILIPITPTAILRRRTWRRRIALVIALILRISLVLIIICTGLRSWGMCLMRHWVGVDLWMGSTTAAVSHA